MIRNGLRVDPAFRTYCRVILVNPSHDFSGREDREAIETAAYGAGNKLLASVPAMHVCAKMIPIEIRKRGHHFVAKIVDARRIVAESRLRWQLYCQSKTYFQMAVIRPHPGNPEIDSRWVLNFGRVGPLMSRLLHLTRYASSVSLTVVRAGGGSGTGDSSGSGEASSENHDPAVNHPPTTAWAFSQSHSPVDWRRNLPAMVPETWMRQAQRFQHLRPTSNYPLLESSGRAASHSLRWRR